MLLAFRQAAVQRRRWRSAASSAAESATQPKMPPWAAIMSSPTRWNSGKYEPTQSDEDEALVAAVVGLADGGVHADLGGHAGDDEAR